MARSSTRATVGKRAEQAALRFLAARGLKLVARNYRSRGGEIDLIMLHDNCLTFVEVRYRSSTRFSCPGPTVDLCKQRKILHAAAMFVASERRYARHTMRFDVVAIAGDECHGISWIRDAFRPGHSAL